MGFVGISTSHSENVVPDNPDFVKAFELLRLFKVRTQPLDSGLTSRELAQCDSLLIGEAHQRLSGSEVMAVRDWVGGGGNLLLLAGQGGDAAARSNLSDLVDGLSFRDDCVGVDKGVTRGRPFDTKLPVPIAQLTGWEGKLCYDTGCSLEVRVDRSMKQSLRAPSIASYVEGIRIRGANVTARNPYPAPAEGHLLFVHLQVNRGSVLAVGSSMFMAEDALIRMQNVEFLLWMLHQWLAGTARMDIAGHREKPQRHRLLHGYPMPSLMSRPSGHPEELNELEGGILPDMDLPLLVGVLPHPYCRPKVKGCGFCTFPHETYSPDKAATVIACVEKEISQFFERQPEFDGRNVTALYFGGGTANLVPRKSFSSLCRTVSRNFGMDAAEVTLEGIPSEFVCDDGALLRLLKHELPARQYRMSMGIQTFDQQRLRLMGRTQFGDTRTFTKAAEISRKLGVSTSADLLFNLPGQTREEMMRDIDDALMLDLDHVCLYHLVLFRTLGTEWSHDPEMLAKLPENKHAAENWMALREKLLSNGYVQRTLTNFEHQRVCGGAKSFQYETCVFQPDACNWVGFGPSAISLLADAGFDRALKWVNAETARDYSAAIAKGKRPIEQLFAYSRRDLKVLYMTRGIASLSVDSMRYQELFGTTPMKDFDIELKALEEADFVTVNQDAIRLTPLGMFYADTVASLIASQQVRAIKARAMVAGIQPQSERWVFSNEAVLNRMG